MIRSAAKATEIKSQAQLVADFASGIFWLPSADQYNEVNKVTRDVLCRHMRDAIDKLSVLMSQYDRLADIESGAPEPVTVEVEIMQDGGDFYDVRAERTLWRFNFPIWSDDVEGAQIARQAFEVYCSRVNLKPVYVNATVS